MIDKSIEKGVKYASFKEKHTLARLQLTKTYNVVSAARLLMALGVVGVLYDYFKADRTLSIWGALLCGAMFLIFVKIHDQLAWKRNLRKALIRINDNELLYLGGEAIPFADGAAYSNPAHAYSYDLDIFGKNSLFQHLNRTATYIGGTRLADLLLSRQSNEKILSNQQAVQELAAKIEWRQEVLAIATLIDDTRKAYEQLVRWAKSEIRELPGIFVAAAYALPVALWVAIAGFMITRQAVWSDAIMGLFLLNLLLLVTQSKRIRQEIQELDKVSEITRLYGLMLEQMEKEYFDSPGLIALKGRLLNETGAASLQLKRLAKLFSAMESIQNGFAAILLNGLFLYHIHTLWSLIRWRKVQAVRIADWLEVIGEFETLNSLANFSYNNPAFAFPLLNDREEIVFQDLGHPLIRKSKRVCNTVDFRTRPFIILTGSNMSGKSTFLRTLGVNMVLAGIGAPVCAVRANIHPLDVWVSMRLSDSLSDSESYFFAEVKRLKLIMNALEERLCFVLLDEILRGTNSDDKRSGTIGVIKKIVEKKAIGAIATHDLEVCRITDDHPDALTNQCFEVEIIHDELSFDYKLREGICKNKSATFLMKKTGIIA